MRTVERCECGCLRSAGAGVSARLGHHLLMWLSLSIMLRPCGSMVLKVFDPFGFGM